MVHIAINMIALLTDFGTADTFAGTMKAVIATISPHMPIIDLTHDIPPQDILSGAWSLSVAYPYLPLDAIIVAVVDPGVGTSRQPIAIRQGERIVIAPDNGILTYILEQYTTDKAVVLDNPYWWRQGKTSATFHGRDIFAPVAAWLARGVSLSEVGTTIDTAKLVRLPLSKPAIIGNQITANVIHIDHYGNIITNIHDELAGKLLTQEHITGKIGRKAVTVIAATFADAPPDRPFWYLDSSGYLAIGWRNNDAAQRLRATKTSPITIKLGK